MNAISSYHGNRPTNTYNTKTQPQTHRQDRLQYTAPLNLAIIEMVVKVARMLVVSSVTGVFRSVISSLIPLLIIGTEYPNDTATSPTKTRATFTTNSSSDFCCWENPVPITLRDRGGSQGGLGTAAPIQKSAPPPQKRRSSPCRYFNRSICYYITRIAGASLSVVNCAPHLLPWPLRWPPVLTFQ